MVTTERMIISPISDEEIQAIIVKEPDNEMKKAYTEMLEGCKNNPDQRIWHAIWQMRLKDESNQVVGELSFKGLNPNKAVEIGYGVRPEFEGKGFMTEAVTAMAKWASTQSGVLSIEAETEDNNIASQRVLQKSGFVPNGVIGEEGPRFVWRNARS